MGPASQLTSGESRGSLASRVQTTNDASLSNKGLSQARSRVALAAPGGLLAGTADVRVGCRRSTVGEALSYVEADPLPLDHTVSTCARSDFTHANGDMMHGPHHPDRSNDDDPPNLYVAGDGNRTC